MRPCFDLCIIAGHNVQENTFCVCECVCASSRDPFIESSLKVTQISEIRNISV